MCSRSTVEWGLGGNCYIAVELCAKKGYKAITSISEIKLKRALEVYTTADFEVFKTTRIANYLAKPLKGNKIDLSIMAGRNWIFEWKDRWEAWKRTEGAQ